MPKTPCWDHLNYFAKTDCPVGFC